MDRVAIFYRYLHGTARKVFLVAIFASAWKGHIALAQNVAAPTGMSIEQAFQSLFTTAGYSTALGGALGAACIGLRVGSATDNLSYIAVGASAGFIFGSVFGVYNLFSPLTLGATYTENSKQKESALQFYPSFKKSGEIETLALSLKIARF